MDRIPCPRGQGGRGSNPRLGAKLKMVLYVKRLDAATSITPTMVESMKVWVISPGRDAGKGSLTTFAEVKQMSKERGFDSRQGLKNQFG